MSYRITDRGRPAPVHDEPPEDRTPVMVRPSWLASVQNSLVGWVTHRGVAAVVAAVEALIGVVAFSRKAVTVSAVAGFGLLLAIWVIGQDFGQIYGGQATDPNTGVIAIVVAVGLLPLRRRRARREFDEGAC
jgi:hypothetical protein